MVWSLVSVVAVEKAMKSECPWILLRLQKALAGELEPVPNADQCLLRDVRCLKPCDSEVCGD